ncbi:MAG: hypothetical protein WC532_02025 [Candidatus Omnitrophota bacterium]
MLSPIVAAMERVELLTFAYEIEEVCSLRYLKRLEDDVATALIRYFADLKLYNISMSRETNFRCSDVSSVFRDARPLRYLKRLFQKGDIAIPEQIKRERPILHLATHDLLRRSEPVFSAFGNKLVFIEVVRHPLYMLKQEEINVGMVLDPRHFEVYYKHKNNYFPYFILGWEDLYLKANSIERAIYMIEHLTKRTNAFKESFDNNAIRAQVITVPFERFVINPWSYMEQIESTLETKITAITRKMMKKQRVPRRMYAEGVGLKIYKRCGWEPPKRGSDENKEFALRRAFAKERGASQEAMDILDRLSADYEIKYLDGKKTY